MNRLILHFKTTITANIFHVHVFVEDEWPDVLAPNVSDGPEAVVDSHPGGVRLFPGHGLALEGGGFWTDSESKLNTQSVAVGVIFFAVEFADSVWIFLFFSFFLEVLAACCDCELLEQGLFVMLFSLCLNREQF